LQKLCDILRFALYENKPERIKVDKEINIMREYIELESIRTSNKNFISFEVTGEAGDVVIAPMLFIPFLENAFKHSGSKKVNAAIYVKLDIMEDKGIKFHCRNLVDQQQQISSDGGLGIELTKQRLSLLYPDKHNLVLKKENDYFEVNLTVNTR
jgi:LytS/YehU family sensor histidine kinase